MRALFSVVRTWKGEDWNGKAWIGGERNGTDRHGLTAASSILFQDALQCGEDRERIGQDGRGEDWIGEDRTGRERTGMDRRGWERKGRTGADYSVEHLR